MTTRQQFFDVIVPGRATCVFTTAPRVVHHDLEHWVSENSGIRLIRIGIDPAEPVTTLLETILDQIANALLAVWPDWYQDPPLLDGREEPDSLRFLRFRAAFVRAVCDERPLVNRTWLEMAATMCQSGKPPKVPGITPQLQARQMRLALAEHELLVALTINETEPVPQRLLGLSRVSEWLAREAEASVLVILPSIVRANEELDGINSLAVDWPAEPFGAIISADAPRPIPPREFAHDDVSVPQTRDPISLDNGEWSNRVGELGDRFSPSVNMGTPRARDERKHFVCPILNRPHPASPGEQILAQYLTRDRELGRLFRFNQRLETVCSSRYLVDLVWSDGRVVVEVDGYGWHSARPAFHADRQRDYELTLSGYLVLRLPHDLVVEDPERACQRIREFVEFRRQHPFLPSS